MVANRGTGLALVAVVVMLGAAGGARAQERDIALESLDQRLTVLQDGTLDVVETLRIRFRGSWNGIERDYWLDHEDETGRVQRLRMDLRSVTDADGTPLRVEEEGISQGRRLRIWVPDANDATRTVLVHFRVPDVIRFWEEGDTPGAVDELYWDVTGNAWEMFIGRASATVSLPAEAGSVQAWAYTGATGSAGQDATVDVVGNEVRIATTRALAPGEGLTISTTWAPGLIARPGPIERFREMVIRFWPLLLPFVGFLAMYRVWLRHGKDPTARAISVQYEPPGDLTPVEVGTLIDHAAEMHDITSMLVDLAVRGYLRIEEREEKKLLGLMSDTEYWFHARRPQSEWGALPAHEQKMMSALFSSPTERQNGLPSVKLDDLENRFYRHVDGIRSAVYQSLIRRGMYTKRPDHARAKWLGVAAAIAVLAFVGSGVVAGQPWLGDPAAIAIGVGLCAVIVAAFAFVMPTRTESGARTQEAALGFKEFLARVEQDRFRRMITSPEQFERYLPYAMAFQVAERWARAFEDLYRTPPEWYQGRPGSVFRTTQLTRSMSAMSSQAGRTMTSSPKSSSSGSGGGGFSGGGSGGGGGRGF